MRIVWRNELLFLDEWTVKILFIYAKQNSKTCLGHALDYIFTHIHDCRLKSVSRQQNNNKLLLAGGGKEYISFDIFFDRF